MTDSIKDEKIIDFFLSIYPPKQKRRVKSVLFYSGKYMESKIIYCPKCGRKVATWDGRSKINIVVNCRKCWKRVVYNVDSGETTTKDIDKKNTSSGMTIY